MATSMTPAAPAEDQPRRAPIGTPGRHPTDPIGRRWLSGVLVVVLLSLLLLPLVPLALSSIGQGYFYPQVLPEVVGGRAWRIVLAADGSTWPALWDSALLAGTVTLLAVVIGLPAGRALGQYRFRGRGLVEFLLLAPVLVPPIAVAIGLHGALLRLGLTGSMTGVVLVHLVPVLPYVVLILAGTFANLDPAYEAQARSLGAGPVAVLRTVTLPAVAPGLATATFFGFLVSWGQYALTLVIGGGQVVTLPILLFASAAGGDTAVTSALALFTAAPALLLLAINAWAVTGRAVPIGGVR